jgi:hypothetical protein
MSWREGAAANTSYAVTGAGGARIYMHRLLLNAPEDMHVDHINRNGLDNRRENLRLVERKHNSMNVNKRLASSSKYVGVMLDKKTGKYKAYCRLASGGRQKHLGYFSTELEAARAYNTFAAIHNQYAPQNAIQHQ